MSIIFSQALTSQNPGNTGQSDRIVIPPLSGASLGQVRVTFQAGSSAAFVAAHCSIGVLNGASAPNIGETFGTTGFNELLFSGVSGFNISATNQLASDWLNFSCLSSDTLVVVIDEGATGGCGALQGTVTSAQWWQKAGASFNSAIVTGFAQIGTGNLYGVTLIETQAGGGGDTFANNGAIIFMRDKISKLLKPKSRLLLPEPGFSF